MRRLLAILVIVVLVILGVLAMTKPERMAHYDMMKRIVLRAVEAKVTQTVPLEDLRTEATYRALGAADNYLRKNLLVYEKTFYNRGVLAYDGYYIPVTIGIMGHVFLLFDEKDIDQFTQRVDLLKIIEKMESRVSTKGK